MDHRVIRSVALGLAAGSLLALAAREVIERPARRAHLPVDCIFSPQAWKAEADIRWHTRGYRESSARERMRADLAAYHLIPGTPVEQVLQMLGPPDNVEHSDGRWVYMTAYSSGLMVWFTRGPVVEGTGSVFYEYTKDWSPVTRSERERVQYGFVADGRLTMQ